jgi:GTP-binding protein YchF
MKLGIIGLPQSGKSTVYEALTGSDVVSRKNDSHLETVAVPDDRIDRLSGMYQPRKTIYAQVAYLLPGRQDGDVKKQPAWNGARDCDALIHVIRNFSVYGMEKADPVSDFRQLDQELIFNDLVVVEKRLERIEADRRRGKKIDAEEHALLKQCLQQLESEQPLRRLPQLAQAPALRGYAFFSGKPILALFNNEDDDNRIPASQAEFESETCMVIRGKLEQELCQMTEDEAIEFLAEFEIEAAAADRVLLASYALQGLISFFTVGEDEVRAWPIKAGTAAIDAAEVIHSDIKKGFIRAEVVAYDDLMAAGSYAEARKRGAVRLEGKTYDVKDGDIINFRFNV